MKAMAVWPERRESGVVEHPEPLLSSPTAARVRILAVGVCGTDAEIVRGDYGTAPPGRDRLVLGHESLGRVLEAPPASGLSSGDLVVGIVRRPDPLPCPNCAVGEWDMCRNGGYTERGIKGLDGYCSERYRIAPEFAVPVDPALGPLGVLLEPASVVAKAWEQVERIGRRARWEPGRAVVTGAGPIGLLAALLGVQKGFAVGVVDIVTEGPKPALVAGLGATYSSDPVAEVVRGADVVMECTGVGQLIFDAMAGTAANGIVCLTGVSPSRVVEVDAGAINRRMVLENDVVVGSVNANRRHYEAAADALAAADPDWLGRLITRREPLERWEAALAKEPSDIKVVLEIAS